MKQVITEEERKQILKNEERIWDMAAMTIAPTIYQGEVQKMDQLGFDLDFSLFYKFAAQEAYNLADALILERRKRLKETP